MAAFFISPATHFLHHAARLSGQIDGKQIKLAL